MFKDWYLPSNPHTEKTVDEVVKTLTTIVIDLENIASNKTTQMQNYVDDIASLQKKHDAASDERDRANKISEKINFIVKP
ncbi:hypothetical protein UFOVP787_96 [uncultured Caudovirales phage]|uniref:Uncharacterized protein n=1 Tax=uncultured Caudovirales phage TaxID=2100421 RepID=A0A6J5NUN8_9CAUD|nr:hypothetical protein UFOVP787_96 [uncultured Caudovirales phage]